MKSTLLKLKRELRLVKERFFWAQPCGYASLNIPIHIKCWHEKIIDNQRIDIMIMRSPDELIYSYCLQANRFQAAKTPKESVEDIIALVCYHIKLQYKQGDPKNRLFPHPADNYSWIRLRDTYSWVSSLRESIPHMITDSDVKTPIVNIKSNSVLIVDNIEMAASWPNGTFFLENLK